MQNWLMEMNYKQSAIRTTVYRLELLAQIFSSRLPLQEKHIRQHKSRSTAYFWVALRLDAFRSQTSNLSAVLFRNRDAHPLLFTAHTHRTWCMQMYKQQKAGEYMRIKRAESLISIADLSSQWILRFDSKRSATRDDLPQSESIVLATHPFIHLSLRLGVDASVVEWLGIGRVWERQQPPLGQIDSVPGWIITFTLQSSVLLPIFLLIRNKAGAHFSGLLSVRNHLGKIDIPNTQPKLLSKNNFIYRKTG